MKYIEHGLLVAEDVEVGVGRTIQTRLNEEYELLQLNASHLLGILVVKTEADLLALDIDILTTKVVYIEEKSAIYRYDSEQQKWIMDEETLLVVNSEEQLPQFPTKYNLVFNTSNNLFYVKNASAWQANGNTVYLITDEDSFDTIPNGINMVMIQGTARLFTKTTTGWQEVAIDTLGDPVLLLNNVEDLPVSSPVTIAIVKDADRGGIFIFNETAVNDDGIVYNKWVRQFVGRVNVKWYGAKGDGVTDDTEAFNKAFVNRDIFIPEGEYLITDIVTVTSHSNILGDKAKLKLTSKGAFSFSTPNSSSGQRLGKLGKYVATIFTSNSYVPEAGTILSVTDQSATLGINSVNTQFTEVLYSTASGVVLGPYLYNDFVYASITEISMSTVVIKNVDINSSTTITPLTLAFCKDSVLDNVTVAASSKEAVSITNCYKLKVVNSTIINTTAVTTNALTIKQSDNISIGNCILSAKTYGLLIGHASSFCYNIKVNNCNITGEKSISASAGCSDLAIDDCKLSGEVEASTFNFSLYRTTVISQASCVKLNSLVGGDVTIDKCTFVGAASVTSHMFITHSNTNTLETLKLARPIDYTITDCEFVDTTGRYLGAIEAVGYGGTNSIAPIKSNLYAKGLTYSGSKTAFIQLIRLGGPFNNVKILNVDASPVCSAKEVYKNNAASLGTSRVRYFNCERFFCDFVYQTTAQYGHNISDKLSSSIRGYRILCNHSYGLFSDVYIHGRHLTLVQNNTNTTYNGTIREVAVDGKLMFEAYLGNTNDIPQSIAISNVLVAQSKQIKIFDNLIETTLL